MINSQINLFNNSIESNLYVTFCQELSLGSVYICERYCYSFSHLCLHFSEQSTGKQII